MIYMKIKSNDVNHTQTISTTITVIIDACDELCSSCYCTRPKVHGVGPFTGVAVTFID